MKVIVVSLLLTVNRYFDHTVASPSQPNQFNVVIYKETSLLFCRADQLIGFLQKNQNRAD